MHSIHLSHKQKAVKVLGFWDVTLQFDRYQTTWCHIAEKITKEGDSPIVYLLSPQLALFFPFSRWQYRIQNLFCLPAVVGSKLG
jgi:hypothetical protein